MRPGRAVCSARKGGIRHGRFERANGNTTTKGNNNTGTISAAALPPALNPTQATACAEGFCRDHGGRQVFRLEHGPGPTGPVCVTGTWPDPVFTAEQPTG